MGSLNTIVAMVGSLLGQYFPIVVDNKGYIDFQYVTSALLLIISVWWVFKILHTFLKGVILGGGCN